MVQINGYIIKKLEKYYCLKVVWVFKKIAHSEINFQLREEAVRHLLSLGHFAELRKQKYMKSHVNNRNRRQYLLNEYAKERLSIDAIPEELDYRVNNSKEQKIKTYDYFISHSSADHDAVQRVIDILNETNINNIISTWKEYSSQFMVYIQKWRPKNAVYQIRFG